MDSTEQEIELSGFRDPDVDERVLWKRVEMEALALADPLSRIIKRKEIIYHLGISEGQLSRELSADYENRLSLSVGLYILRHSQHDRLAKVLICDAAGYVLPQPQHRKVTSEMRLKAYEEVCRRSGPAGEAMAREAELLARSTP